MGKSRIGIEIGTTSLKISEVKNNELVRFYREDVPENMVVNGQLVSFSELSSLLKHALKAGGFKSRNACLVVPDSSTFTRRLVLPIMTDAQLKVNLPYEFHDFISDDKDNYFYDYALISVDEQQANMDLLGVAVNKELIENYQSAFRASGLKLVKALPQCIAIQDLCNELISDEKRKELGVVDLAYNSTRIFLYANDSFQTSRVIEGGIRSVVEQVANKLNTDPHIGALYLVNNNYHVLQDNDILDSMDAISVSIMRAMNYYSYENRDSELSTLYLCGGGSLLEPLVTSIQSQVSLEVVPLSTLAETDNEKQALTYGPATFGVCLQED